MPPVERVMIHKRCRACGGDLEEVLQLGSLCLNDFPAHPWDIQKIPQVPLILTVCTQCGLAQLDRTVPPDWMYREYWYRSGVNEMMVAELGNVVGQAIYTVHGVTAHDHVLDIGANDGTLLSMYETPDPALQPKRVAVEPALNLADRLDAHCELRISDYFPTPTLLENPLRFKVITAIACIYDMEDPLAFFRGIQKLLTPDGVAILQFQDFGQMLACAAFDNIGHEHLEYYTLHSLIQLVDRVGLQVHGCTQTSINGGSLRVVLRHQKRGRLEDPTVLAQLTRERAQGLGTDQLIKGFQAFITFRKRVEVVKQQIRTVLHQVRDAGVVLDIYGASTKGNVLLQVLGIGAAQVRQAIDRSPEKHGRYTLTGIPIVGEALFSEREGYDRSDTADVWLCPIWQFRPSVLARNLWFLKGGGQIIFPLPQVEIVKESWRVPGGRP